MSHGGLVQVSHARGTWGSGVGSIALFTYSTVPRGSVVHAAHLADALHDAGADVTLYALDKDGRGFFRPTRAPLRLVPAGPAPPTTTELVRQRSAELGAYLARERPHHDILHAQDCLTASALIEHADRRRLVRTVHHVEHFHDPSLAACQERSICGAALCLTVSAAAEQDVLAAFGIHCARVANGVDLARFAEPDLTRVAVWRARLTAESPPSNTDCRPADCRPADCRPADCRPADCRPADCRPADCRPADCRPADADRRPSDADRLRSASLRSASPLLLAVGGVEQRKNTVATLAAFAAIHTRHPGARLIILGGATVLDHGAYRAQFDAALAQLPTATRAHVRELGTVDEPDVPAIFHAADVLVFPSIHEGFGLAALEALAAGLPVVASNRPPLTEFLDEECAILVDPTSAAAIADGIERALSSTPAIAALRRAAGARRAAHLSWPRAAALHLDHYAALARR